MRIILSVHLPSQIEHLYVNEQMSMQQVADTLNLTLKQVISHMRKNNIPRRTSAETRAHLFLKSPSSFQVKSPLTQEEHNLQLVGLALYWAEGSKRTKHSVDFANSDEKAVLTFLDMLRRIYQVQESRLRVFIYCHSNLNPKSLIKHWSQILNISPEQFTQPYIKKANIQAQSNQMRYGLVHVRYHDKRLLMEILRQIDIIGTAPKNTR